MSESVLTADYDGHNLIVVAGSPRSGTSWFQKLLASHPKIKTGKESLLFREHIGPQLAVWRETTDPKYFGTGLSCYMSEDDFLPIVKWYLVRLLEPMVGNLRPGELFVEKTPGNALYLQEIFELLPQVRIINVLRDARDVVSSMTSREAWLSAWAPSNAKAAAHMWARHVDAVRNATPKIPAKQFLEIRYETMLQDPVEVLRQSADFIGLPWDLADIKEAVAANRADKAKVTGGTPIPVYGDTAKRSGSIAVRPKEFIRKAKAGSWKTDLSFVQKFWVWRAAHRTMEENGYHWPKSYAVVFASVSSIMNSARFVFKRLILGEVQRQS